MLFAAPRSRQGVKYLSDFCSGTASLPGRLLLLQQSDRPEREHDQRDGAERGEEEHIGERRVELELEGPEATLGESEPDQQLEANEDEHDQGVLNRDHGLEAVRVHL